MRCPKCHYLSFDPEPRCRNCGYGLSLDEADLFVREEDGPPSPFADLSLHTDSNPPLDEKTAAPAAPVPQRPTDRQPESPFAAIPEPEPDAVADRAAVLLPPPKPRPAPTTELPLFVRGAAAAEVARAAGPVVRVPSDAAPPLSVRRRVPEPPAAKPRPVRPTSERTAGPLDRDLLAELPGARERPAPSAQPSRAPEQQEAVFHAGAARRLTAAVIDGIILGTLWTAIMWLTLRWCGLPLDGALMVPLLVPTSAFLALVGVGYLVTFTAAGGQTLGKMAAGIRVIGDAPTLEETGPLSVPQAVVRAVVTLPSVLVVGLGFLPALVGDERAVHDRLAHTRVVRA